MKQNVSLSELSKYLARHRPKSIVFRYDDQKEYDVAEPFKLRAAFKQIEVFEFDPCYVYLISAYCALMIDTVTGAYIDSETIRPDTILTVFCKNGREFDLLLRN